MSPSAPFTLLTNTAGVPALPPLTGIRTTVSLPVLTTNIAERSPLNASPFAPNGGTPEVCSNRLVTRLVTGPPVGPVRQIRPGTSRKCRRCTCHRRSARSGRQHCHQEWS